MSKFVCRHSNCEKPATYCAKGKRPIRCFDHKNPTYRHIDSICHFKNCSKDGMFFLRYKIEKSSKYNGFCQQHYLRQKKRYVDVKYSVKAGSKVDAKSKPSADVKSSVKADVSMDIDTDVDSDCPPPPSDDDSDSSDLFDASKTMPKIDKPPCAKFRKRLVYRRRLLFNARKRFVPRVSSATEDDYKPIPVKVRQELLPLNISSPVLTNYVGSQVYTNNQSANQAAMMSPTLDSYQNSSVISIDSEFKDNMCFKFQFKREIYNDWRNLTYYDYVMLSNNELRKKILTWYKNTYTDHCKYMSEVFLQPLKRGADIYNVVIRKCVITMYTDYMLHHGYDFLQNIDSSVVDSDFKYDSDIVISFQRNNNTEYENMIFVGNASVKYGYNIKVYKFGRLKFILKNEVCISC